MKPSSEEEIAAESITPINQSSVKDDEHWGGSDFYSIGDQALTWVDSVFCHFSAIHKKCFFNLYVWAVDRR